MALTWSSFLAAAETSGSSGSSVKVMCSDGSREPLLSPAPDIGDADAFSVISSFSAASLPRRLRPPLLLLLEGVKPLLVRLKACIAGPCPSGLTVESKQSAMGYIESFLEQQRKAHQDEIAAKEVWRGQIGR